MTTYAQSYSNAQFANLAYQTLPPGKDIGNGWTVEKSFTDTDSGFAAYAFRNETTHEIERWRH